MRLDSPVQALTGVNYGRGLHSRREMKGKFISYPVGPLASRQHRFLYRLFALIAGARGVRPVSCFVLGAEEPRRAALRAPVRRAGMRSRSSAKDRGLLGMQRGALAWQIQLIREC